MWQIPHFNGVLEPILPFLYPAPRGVVVWLALLLVHGWVAWLRIELWTPSIRASRVSVWTLERELLDRFWVFTGEVRSFLSDCFWSCFLLFFSTKKGFSLRFQRRSTYIPKLEYFLLQDRNYSALCLVQFLLSGVGTGNWEVDSTWKFFVRPSELPFGG